MNLRSLLARFTNRATPENPATSLADPDSWLFDTLSARPWLWNALGSRTASSGVAVDATTALEVTSVWAAVRRISSTIATLPLHTYQVSATGKEKAVAHPVYKLLHVRPNPYQSAFTFREQMLAHLLIYGDWFCEVERDGKGQALALWPLNPVNVRIEFWGERKDQKVYIVRVGGQDVPLSPDDMLHIPGFSLDGQRGLIPVLYAREAIGIAKATEQFGSTFFANGAQPSGVLMHPGKLGKVANDNLKASWNASFGGLSNAQRLAILEEGMSYLPLGIAPEHAQFLETRKFTVAEIARVFLLPPHLLGDLERATFSNIESQGIDYLVYCIEPWTTKIEQELNYKLFGDAAYLASFDLTGLLRGDSSSRAAWYTQMLSNGVLSVNEVRAMENLNNIGTEGDTRIRPANMVPLGSPAPSPSTAPGTQDPNEGTTDDQQ